MSDSSADLSPVGSALTPCQGRAAVIGSPACGGRHRPDVLHPALGAGYFDQAHFGHEFRAFTGLTPTRYVEVRRRFLREHPGHALDGWPLPAD